VFPQEVRRRIGYLPETPPLYADMTVEDYLRFAGRARGLRGIELKDRLDTVVTDCGLRTKLKARIIELSKGFKQRTGLAQALIHNPDVLILDEPTSGLDPMQIVEIRKLIDRLRENRCIIFSTHILQEATAVADRLVIVNGGRKVADGTVDELSHKAIERQSVRLLAKGADAKLVEPLRNVQNVQQVEITQGPTGYGRYNLIVGGGLRGVRAACEEIAAMVQTMGHGLAELAPEKLTLEQIFLQLLQKGNAAPATQPAKAEQPEAVVAELPADLEATAAVTRIADPSSTGHEIRSDAASETAWPPVEGDAFETFNPGSGGREVGTSTEYSPKPPDKEDK
jgi:ABC-2 type transport system ATP-binding protein